MFSLTAELFLMRIVQTLHSSGRQRRYNVRLNWVVLEVIFRYRKLFVRIRCVTEKELSNVVRNNRCTAHLLRGLHLSVHKGLVFGILVCRCQKHLMMKNQFDL